MEIKITNTFNNLTYTLEKHNENYVIKEYEGKNNRGHILANINKIDKPLNKKSKGIYPYWYISNYGDTIMEFPQGNKFDTEELAYQFIVMVRQAYLAEINRRPLTEVANRYITNKAKSLRDRTSSLVSMMYDLSMEKWELLQLSKQCGVEEALVYIDDSDLGQAIDKLLNYKYGKEEAPFFSESVLYELIGKDAARSILGHLQQLIKLIAPERFIEL